MKESKKPLKTKDVKTDSAKLNVQILFENKNILAVYKPAGLIVHSDGKTAEPTLCDWVLEKYPEIAGVGEPARTPQGKMVDRPGIVHRLDRDTSGVLLIAKNQKAFEYLKKEFQEHHIQKTYNVFVWGDVKEDEGKIDRPIGRSKSDFRKWSAERFAKGDLREALTEYKVLARYENKINEEKLKEIENDPQFGKTRRSKKIDKNKKLDPITFLEVYPKTGRTHQIRVHFKAINHPVLGDTLYAPKRPMASGALGFNRLALHARKIEFTDLNGKKVEVEAPLPEDFRRALSVIDVGNM